MTPPETPDCNHDAPASFAGPSGSLRCSYCGGHEQPMRRAPLGALACNKCWLSWQRPFIPESYEAKWVIVSDEAANDKVSDGR